MALTSATMVLERIVKDLEGEQVRFITRIARLATNTKGGLPHEVSRELIQKLHLEANLEYVELLLLRYKGWINGQG